MKISDFDYDLPDERIAKYPVNKRDTSKLLVWQGGRRCGCEAEISETIFSNIRDVLPEGSLLVFNDTRVVRARLVMQKPTHEGTATKGARIEILCLEPCEPADYERAFAARGACEWHCMVGNSKRWKEGPVEIRDHTGKLVLQAWRAASHLPPLNPDQPAADQRASVDELTLPNGRVRFEWESEETFGEILERLGRVPIPPYLGRDSDAQDVVRYQTVYATIEGSVAAPTAGLHFTPELISELGSKGIEIEKVTLHVGAGTFLPVKTENALDHPMHTEHFEVTLKTVEHLSRHLSRGEESACGPVIAVGTTSVRTLESLVGLGWRIAQSGDCQAEIPVRQFELNEIPAEFTGVDALEVLADYMRARELEKISASTQIMITPGFGFRIVGGLVTNFHQPQSTLLLLVSAFTGGRWREIYDYALAHEFRFLSYGDSSLLLP